jgi:hypothetical protein
VKPPTGIESEEISRPTPGPATAIAAAPETVVV